MTNLRVVRCGNLKKKEVALTFDDGPNPHSTEKILKLLDIFDVKATFFVIGSRCLSYPDLLVKIYEKGHLIGNHSKSHKIGDFKKNGKIIKKIIGIDLMYVRPPFYNLSFCDMDAVYLADKFIITGDVDSKDYLPISSGEVVENVLNAVVAGSIIDFHDGSEEDDELADRSTKTVNALPEIIKNLQAKFNLVRVDEMDLQIENYPI